MILPSRILIVLIFCYGTSSGLVVVQHASAFSNIASTSRGVGPNVGPRTPLSRSLLNRQQQQQQQQQQPSLGQQIPKNNNVFSLTAISDNSNTNSHPSSQQQQRQQQRRRRWWSTLHSRVQVGQFKLQQLGATFVPMSESNNTNIVSNNDPILIEFQNKEAAIQLKREKAEALLASYDGKLQELQTRKQQYLARDQLPTSPVGGSFTETALRSAVKAFVWRLLAGSITFLTTLQFSGSLNQAIKVVSADFFSKVLTMFIGERLMNKSQAGRGKGGDNAKRSLIKALIWRLFAVSNTLVMAIFISKDLSIASKIASTDAVFKTSLMFFYERFWANVKWGKEYLIEFSI